MDFTHTDTYAIVCSCLSRYTETFQQRAQLLIKYSPFPRLEKTPDLKLGPNDRKQSDEVGGFQLGPWALLLGQDLREGSTGGIAKGLGGFPSGTRRQKDACAPQLTDWEEKHPPTEGARKVSTQASQQAKTNKGGPLQSPCVMRFISSTLGNWALDIEIEKLKNKANDISHFLSLTLTCPAPCDLFPNVSRLPQGRRQSRRELRKEGTGMKDKFHLLRLLMNVI